ncbi:MAG: ABC transporter substrate-binding protein [Lachnospiraceae bacterium]|nr:ABC transporter substrate-binding protein [Lachnospiraceae bacterium]
MKKKIVSLMLTAVLGLTLAGCGEAAQSDTYKIGVCQIVEHPALDAATQGFQDALKEKLGEDKVTFDVQNAQGEQPTAATICNGFVSANVDLILANATTPLQCAAAATTTIPVLGTSITDYATALEVPVEEWTGASGRNVSGTSDLAPIDEQENMILELFPGVQTVGLMYCSAEANSKYQIQLIEAELDADGIAYKEYAVADSNEIQSVFSTAVTECEVLYIPTDNTLANSTETIRNIVVPAGIPVVAGEEGICSGCGVATLSISYYDLGYATGEMAAQILLDGKDISTMEIQYAPTVTKEYNAELCDTLGISVPSDYVAIGE